MASNRLTEIREAAGIKRHELAVELAVDPSTVYRWETKHIPTEYIEKLTKRFEVTSDHLLGLDRVPAQSGKAA